MASVTVQAGWCMGHRLPNHQGKCFNLHGHQYTAEVTVKGRIDDVVGAPSQGMVTDFTNVKTKLREITEQWDHKLLLAATDPISNAMSAMPGVVIVSWIPTAENIARAIFLLLPLQDAGTTVASVKVWETPTSFAEYTAEDLKKERWA